MSKEAAATFLAKVDSDATMQDQIKSLDGSSGFDALQDFAAAQGYNFSLDDLVAAGKERSEAGLTPGGELSESELETVAGGAKSNFTIKYTKDSLVVTVY